MCFDPSTTSLIARDFQDDSGTIEMAELVEIIGTLYEMEVVTSLKK